MQYLICFSLSMQSLVLFRFIGHRTCTTEDADFMTDEDSKRLFSNKYPQFCTILKSFYVSLTSDLIITSPAFTIAPSQTHPKYSAKTFACLPISNNLYCFHDFVLPHIARWFWLLRPLLCPGILLQAMAIPLSCVAKIILSIWFDLKTDRYLIYRIWDHCLTS